MASVHNNLRSHLLTKANITQHVAGRIYVGKVPQHAERPYITLFRISHQHEHHMGAAAGLAQAAIQIDCFSTTQRQADQLSEAVRDAIDGYRGYFGSGLDVRDCYLTDEADEYIDPTDRSERGTFRNRLDVSIWHSESVPAL